MTEMARQKPTIALIPGAWLNVSSYSTLLESLEKAGFTTAQAELLSRDPEDVTACNIDNDAKHIKNGLFQSLIEEQGKDVVLLMHSYGGEPGSTAAVGLSKSERAQAGKEGGVVGFISLSGFILAEGSSCNGAQGGPPPAWVQQNTPSQGLTMPGKPMFYLLNGVNEDLAAQAVSQLRPHAAWPFDQPQPKTAWIDSRFEGRRGYIMCKDDQAVPLAGQQAMVQYSGCDWEVIEIDGGHCTYVDRPDVVTEAVVKMLEKFGP